MICWADSAVVSVMCGVHVVHIMCAFDLPDLVNFWCNLMVWVSKSDT